MQSATIEKARPAHEERRVDDSGAMPYRWTVDSFFRAVERGAFDNPERLELLDGEVVERMAQGIPHYYSVRAVATRVPVVFAEPCEIRQSGRWTLSDVDYVEPDVLFAVGTFMDYIDRDPRVDEILLVVEVSDTTLQLDRGRKGAKYARIGVAEYWIVNVSERQIEVYRDPAPMPESQWGYGYRTVTYHKESESIRPLTATGAGEIRVADLLPGH